MELLTAAASEEMQRCVAGALAARGVGAGERIAVVASSSGAMVSAVIGALRAGIIPVVLNPALLEGERALLLADAEPSLVVDDAVLAELRRGPPSDLAPAPRGRPMHYTSGTTGRPKGVWSGVLDEADAAALLGEERDQWGFEAGDVHLLCSPFHHAVAIRFSTGTLLAGGSVIVPGRFEGAAAARALSELRPTTTFMVPSHLQRLFAAAPHPDFSSLRLLAHAAEPCPEPMKRRLVAAAGAERVWEFYGSTEGQFTACSAAEWLERPGTVGRARAGRRLSTDPDGTIWCEVPPHARWEYWRDPDRTALAWRPPSDPSAFGTFTVGDLGRLDDDGYLFLEGRRDDLIISGGVNVYPVEVEQALARIPGVAEVAVFGVPDERWGQRVCAAVVGDAAPETVRAGARELLAAYKCPKDVYRVAALPYTATGKLQRHRLASVLGLD